MRYCAVGDRRIEQLVSEDLLQLPLLHGSVPEQGSADAAAAVRGPRSGVAGDARGPVDAHQRRVQVESSPPRAPVGRRSPEPRHATDCPRSQVRRVHLTPL